MYALDLSYFFLEFLAKYLNLLGVQPLLMEVGAATSSVSEDTHTLICSDFVLIYSQLGGAFPHFF